MGNNAAFFVIKMKLWIIYKEGLGFLKIIAEILQDRLEEFFDVSVGNAKKIDPSMLVEERLECLIIGDFIREEFPNDEIQNWLLNFWKISSKSNYIIKALSGFYIVLSDSTFEPLWVKSIENKTNIKKMYPPILPIMIIRADLTLDGGTHESIKEFVKNFIDYYVVND